MIRFLRGHNFDIDKVSNLMTNFFKWRIDNKVDEIRTNIVERGMDHPLKFPKGELILSLIPQLILVPNAQDKLGSPICVEQYNFTPSEVFKYITIDDYILFVLYSLEFKSLIVEALSEQREQAFLNSLTKAERTELESNPNSKPYGVIVNICVVRDLSKFFDAFAVSKSIGLSAEFSNHLPRIVLFLIACFFFCSLSPPQMVWGLHI